MVVKRDALKGLLVDWQAGKTDERKVHETAEAWVEAHGLAQYAESDDKSVAVEILLNLDSINVQLIIKEDVPAMLQLPFDAA